METKQRTGAQATAIEKFSYALTDEIMKRGIRFDDGDEVNEQSTALDIIGEAAFILSNTESVDPADITNLLIVVNDYATRANDHLTQRTAKGAALALGLLLSANMTFERVRDNIQAISTAYERDYNNALRTKAMKGGAL